MDIPNSPTPTELAEKIRDIKTLLEQLGPNGQDYLWSQIDTEDRQAILNTTDEN